MTEPLQELKDAVIEGYAEQATALARACLEAGIPAEEIFERGIIAGIQETGLLWDCNRYCVPDVVLAADAFNAAVAVIERQLRERADWPRHKAVLGVVEGDVHDLGKNIVSAMLQGAGFQVVDLGVDNPVERFVAAVRSERPAIVGIGAYLSTTMPLVAEILRALEAAGLRSGVKVLVGGVLTSQQFADEVGADGWAPDASSAARLALRLVGRGDDSTAP